MMQGLRGSGESMPQKTTKKNNKTARRRGEVCNRISEWREKNMEKRIFPTDFWRYHGKMCWWIMGTSGEIWWFLVAFLVLSSSLAFVTNFPTWPNIPCDLAWINLPLLKSKGVHLPRYISHPHYFYCIIRQQESLHTENKPGCFGYYPDCFRNHYKDPYYPTSIMESRRVFSWLICQHFLVDPIHR